MTPDQTDRDPTQDGPPAPAQGGTAAPETRLPPESRAARSLIDRSRPEDTPTDHPHPHPEPERGPRVWPRVVGVLILLLGVGGAWLWQNPGFIQQWLPGSANPDMTSAIQALEARVARLEQRPPPDLTPLTRRLDALEQRPPSAAPAVDLRPLLARLDALEARARVPAAPLSGGSSVLAGPANPSSPDTDLEPLLARLDALERRAGERVADPAKVDAIAAQVQALSEHDAASDAKQAQGSDRALRLARLDAAEIDLAAGHKLGPIPDVPPALARFAAIAPPTEAALRLAFPAASEAALRVSLPDTEGKPFLDRVLARLQDFRLITVREGDHVLIGNSTAAILARARVLLDAGDLDGAVKAVATLSGPPADKMAAWLAEAAALQAAREALALLVEQG